MYVYVGTYTSGESRGIYRFRLDPATGEVSDLELAAETVNPSFLALHPDGRFLYAVSEVSSFEGEETGAISAFRIDPDSGQLNLLNQIPSGGTGPCYLTTDSGGRFVLAANYGGGTVSSTEILPDGSLGRMLSRIQHQGSGTYPGRQGRPHAHSIRLDPSENFAVAADLGADKLFIYRVNTDTGALEPRQPPDFSMPAESGPRHLAFHPNMSVIYVINELASTISVIENRDFRSFREIQRVSTVPDGTTGKNWTAEVLVHPSGRFLYGSNRGHDSIAAYSINPATGRLTMIGTTPTGGKTPRNFTIDPNGRYLLAANQHSSNITVFAIDPQSGGLQDTGHRIDVPNPVCIRFLVNPA